MSSDDDPEIEILIFEDGTLTIEGRPVTLENGSVEAGCIVGSLRAPGVYIPRISIPLDLCRMAAVAEAGDDARRQAPGYVPRVVDRRRVVPRSDRARQRVANG